MPILYLPRVTRQELRAPEDCPWALQPLVELQYRGRVWHQRNGRDWTVEAFLVSEDGLGLDVAQDTRAREALLRALALLAEVPIESLRGRRLDADDFDRLAVSDPVCEALYEPWLEATARHFQSPVAGTGDASRTLVTGTVHEKDVCVLFADGLRYDVAGLLRERLEARGFGVRLGYRLAPLPTVTATAKPLASPVHDALDGDPSSEDFTPRFKETAQPATAPRLRDKGVAATVVVLDTAGNVLDRKSTTIGEAP